jgi:predicted permease
MTHVNTLVQSLAVLIALILCTFWLKRRQILTAEHRTIFSRLVTDFALPALIFETLARRPFEPQDLLPAFIMLMTSVVCLVLGWLVGRWFGLENPKLGALVLVSGFGSSASLGYALVQQMMGGNARALNDALIIGEFGSTMPFFVIGVPIAIYFGGADASGGNKWAPSMAFFKSPIFIAMVLGIGFSFVRVPDHNPVIACLRQVLNIIGGSLMLTVALSIGLMLRPVQVKSLLPLIFAVIALKLLVQPLLAFALAKHFGLPGDTRTVLVVECAMPSGLVATVVGARYGLDGAMASAITITTYFASVVTMPLILLLAG